MTQRELRISVLVGMKEDYLLRDDDCLTKAVAMVPYLRTKKIIEELCDYIEELEAKIRALDSQHKNMLDTNQMYHRLYKEKADSLKAKLKKYEEPVYAFDFDACKIKGIESGTGREKGFENLKYANPIKVIIIEADK